MRCSAGKYHKLQRTKNNFVALAFVLADYGSFHSNFINGCENATVSCSSRMQKCQTVSPCSSLPDNIIHLPSAGSSLLNNHNIRLLRFSGAFCLSFSNTSSRLPAQWFFMVNLISLRIWGLLHPKPQNKSMVEKTNSSSKRRISH